MDKSLKIYISIIIILLAGILLKYLNGESFLQADSTEVKTPIEFFSPTQKAIKPVNTVDILAGKYNLIGIPVNPMEKFSEKSRNEIFNIRNKYVSESPLKPQNYDASKGTALREIVDGKPWISINFYGKVKPLPTGGESARSKIVNNPSLLVAMIENNGRYNVDDGEPLRYFIPKAIYYEKKSNTVVAHYPFSEFVKRYFIGQRGNFNYTNFQLSGLNARDFGYEFGYVDEMHNIKFLELDNISNQITQFRDFIHLGYACGAESGCNNISPHQPNLCFKVISYKNNPRSSEETYLHIKLWRNRPANHQKPADANMLIVLK